MGYTVLTEHASGTDGTRRRARKAHFGTFEEALAYGESIDPMRNLSTTTMFLCIDPKRSRVANYERGLFSVSGSKYGVILSNTL